MNVFYKFLKLFLSLSCIDFAVRFPFRAVRISSGAVTRFPGPITSWHTALIRDLFSFGFPSKLRAGPYESYDNKPYFYISLVSRHILKLSLCYYGQPLLRL